MAVRAKFRVTEIKDAGWGENWPGVKNITLWPVGGAVGGENAQAAAQFAVGQEFYVDFTPAEA